MECEYCQKTLSTKSNLKVHQVSKYCLEKQGKTTKINSHICTWCEKLFSSRQMLNIHSIKCSLQAEKIKNQILEKDDIIASLTNDMSQIINEKDKIIAVLQAEVRIYKQLSECVEEIAKQPKIQTQTTQNIQNNKLLNMKPLDLEDVKVKERMLEIATEFFGRDYFNDGQKGVARFTAEKLLRDSDGKLQYRCTDPSRQTFKFLTNNGDIRTDVKAKLLSKILDETVVRVTRDLVRAATPSLTSDEFISFSENFMQIKDISNDNTDFRSELAALTTN